MSDWETDGWLWKAQRKEAQFIHELNFASSGIQTQDFMIWSLTFLTLKMPNTTFVTCFVFCLLL